MTDAPKYLRVGRSKKDPGSACWYLQISKGSLMKHIEAGHFRIVTLKPGGIRVLRDSIDRFMADDSEREDAAYLEVAGRAGL